MTAITIKMVEPERTGTYVSTEHNMGWGRKRGGGYLVVEQYLDRRFETVHMVSSVTHITQ